MPHQVQDWLEAFRHAGDGTASPNMPGIRQLRVLVWLQTEHLTSVGAFQANISHTTQTVRLSRRPPAGGSADTEVRGQDFLDAARELHGQGLRVAVLNMASARRPGGGVTSGAGAQEENLHRRSDTWKFLHAQRMTYYPIPREACLLSRGVTIFRGSEAAGYPLEEPFQVDVISSAAPAHPPLDSSNQYARWQDEDAMQMQIELILEAAHLSGCQALVLSAFGCGAFGNPPWVVARLFREALLRQASQLRRVVFCILNDHNSGHSHNPEGNFRPFAETFKASGARSARHRKGSRAPNPAQPAAKTRPQRRTTLHTGGPRRGARRHRKPPRSMVTLQGPPPAPTRRPAPRRAFPQGHRPSLAGNRHSTPRPTASHQCPQPAPARQPPPRGATLRDPLPPPAMAADQAALWGTLRQHRARTAPERLPPPKRRSEKRPPTPAPQLTPPAAQKPRSEVITHSSLAKGTADPGSRAGKARDGPLGWPVRGWMVPTLLASVARPIAARHEAGARPLVVVVLLARS